jgi:hypothetical protein
MLLTRRLSLVPVTPHPAAGSPRHTLAYAAPDREIEVSLQAKFALKTIISTVGQEPPISEGGRSESGTLIGVGPGLCRMWASE